MDALETHFRTDLMSWLKDELGAVIVFEEASNVWWRPLHQDQPARAQKPLQISSTCTVFAESEVVTLVAEGVTREGIAAGLHPAIAKRTLSMVKRLGLVPPVAMAGGVVKAIEEETGERQVVPSELQIMGALGAPILAMQRQQGEAHQGEEARRSTTRTVVTNDRYEGQVVDDRYPIAFMCSSVSLPERSRVRKGITGTAGDA